MLTFEFLPGELLNVCEFVLDDHQVGQFGLAAACFVLKFLDDALKGHLSNTASTSPIALPSFLKQAYNF